MFITGLALFSVGSLLAGVAWSFPVLILGRVVQGIGAAIAAPTALSLISTSFPAGKDRSRAFAVYAAVTGGGGALGLLLGGVLTEYFDWRWVLFVNVPIGVLLTVGAFFFIRSTERLTGRFDLLGSLLSVAGMLALVYGFIRAAATTWSNDLAIASFGAAVVLLAAFVLWEHTYAHAMLPLRILGDRNRAGANVVNLIIGAALFGMLYFITYFVQSVLGFSALRTGLAFLPFSAVLIAGSTLVVALLPKIGPRPLIVVGSALMAVALFLLSLVDPQTHYASGILPSVLLMAAGMSMLFVPLTMTGVSKVAETDSGVTSALLNVGQQIGGAIGLSVLATVAATAARNETSSQVATLAGQGAEGKSAIAHLAELAGGTPTIGARGDAIAVDAINQIQSYAAGQGFLVAACFGLGALVISLFVINVKKEDIAEDVSPEVLAGG